MEWNAWLRWLTNRKRLVAWALTLANLQSRIKWPQLNMKLYACAWPDHLDNGL